MKKIARKAALDLLAAGEKKKTWTPEERKNWTGAFNALQRLSGHKVRMGRKGAYTPKRKAA